MEVIKCILNYRLTAKPILNLLKSFKMVFAIVVFMTTVNALHNLKTGLITVIGIELKDFDKVIKQLRRLGFSGFVGVSHDEEHCDEEWYDPNFFIFVKI